MDKAAIFICNVVPAKTEGIYKKVEAQARVISKKYEICHFIAPYKNKTYHLTYMDGKLTGQENLEMQLYTAAKSIVYNEKVSYAYVRRMLPSLRHIIFLLFLKRKKVNVTYEIPTYPYFGEQFNNSTHKLRTGCRILLDCVTWPIIYLLINKLVVIKSRSDVHIYKKMCESTNGIALENIKSNVHNQFKSGEVHIVIVGTLYAYHGIDRLIRGIQCYSGNEQVFFHVIGESIEIDKMKNMVRECNVNNVIFHGRKTTEELDDLSDKRAVFCSPYCYI